ncbi:hypothetical protein HYH02_000079 [Chlamydomonas schloesseri]|uniref:Transcription initiation factor TFIID subunit 8 n=1 Tax=Chlamydomonas schloesseri TaxID=2026947 RepID=A0A836B7P8_9CHLO|nr:hypothetical protein HYH02_000079 [Chlamydomonas schloesseri]|eukprot:KAG2449975.1 hypothetical protein HYH02_000079 [Chlamydomonas schloesseri]
MAEDYSRRVARVVAAQMAELTGFEAAQESAVEILAELLIKYIQEVCTAAHSYAELSHRTDINICDLNLALGDMGTSTDDLRKYLDSWIAEQGRGTFDQGFVHPLPPEYPIRAPGRTLPSWEERREEAPAHIPSWLPAFPDRHTYVRTPAFPGHEEDPVKQSEVIRQTRRQAAKTTLAFKQQLLAVPPHPVNAAIGSNPFLSVPTVELVGPSGGGGGGTGAGAGGPGAAGVGAGTSSGAGAAAADKEEASGRGAGAGDGAGGSGGAAAPGAGLAKEVVHPASTAFEPVVGPVAMDEGGPGAGGGEDRRREMDTTVKWQQVQDAPSGSSALGLPAGYTLDLATRVQRQGQAFTAKRVVDDAYAARAAEESHGPRFGTGRSRASRFDMGDERKKAEHILAQAAEVKGHGGDHMFVD